MSIEATLPVEPRIFTYLVQCRKEESAGAGPYRSLCEPMLDSGLFLRKRLEPFPK